MAAQTKQPSFRPEIEGLRAIAIGLVLVFHAGAPVLRGGFVGVDVFFVISGFLITSHIVKELRQTGKLSLLDFWSRRMKRLLPAALTVLAATTFVSWLVLPVTSWRSVGNDIVTASLYVVNWRFAANAVDYNAEGMAVSPVLHFWSLAVEEQFYIIWPALLALTAWVFFRKLGVRRITVVLGILITVVAVPSFLYSLWLTPLNPDLAFFVTGTRLWELGVGAGVALGVALWPKLPRAFALALGYIGVAAVLTAALLFTEELAWPGYAAALPVLGTAAVIVATTGKNRGVARLLSVKPLVWVGGLSYSWYLWHWPVLVLAQAHWGELRLRYRILLVLFSGVLAWLSLKLIENPIRRSRALAGSPRLTLSFGTNLSLLGVVAGMVLVLLVPSSSTASRGDLSALGANQLTVAADGSIEPYEAPEAVEEMTPSPALATEDVPESEREECIVRNDSSDVVTCDFGDPQGSLDIALVGDSKIQQWQPAISSIAERNGWKIRTYFKSSCAFAQPDYTRTAENRRTCAEWNEKALAELQADSPDVVITTTRTVFQGMDEAGGADPGARMIAAWWEELLADGIAVLPLIDNPDPGMEVYECVAKHADQLSECTADKEHAIEISGAKFQMPAIELTGLNTWVLTEDIVCPTETTCPPVIGDVLVYRQGSHLTNTYVETATNILEPRLVAGVEAAISETRTE